MQRVVSPHLAGELLHYRLGMKKVKYSPSHTMNMTGKGEEVNKDVQIPLGLFNGGPGALCC